LDFGILHKKGGYRMYNSNNVAERINTLLQDKKISQKEMLLNLQLNKNAISTMIYRNSMPKADNLAKIADYLNCSVDYLLGRTDNPEINR